MFYDYQQLPLRVADEAFADFLEHEQSNDILILPDYLIKHCDAWCRENSAFSEHDNRVEVINAMQAYIHNHYAAELSGLMKANISKFKQKQVVQAMLAERRN